MGREGGNGGRERREGREDGRREGREGREYTREHHLITNIVHTATVSILAYTFA